MGTDINSNSPPTQETWNFENILIMNMRRAVSAIDFAMHTLEPTPKGQEARLRAGTDPLIHLKRVIELKGLKCIGHWTKLNVTSLDEMNQDHQSIFQVWMLFGHLLQ